MQRVPAYPLVYEFSRHEAPRCRIQPGETIVVESEDAFSGQVRTNSDRRDKTKVPQGNPVAGPILVEGAQRGDCLAVQIHEIRPSIGQCATRTAAPQQLCEWLGMEVPHGTHICPIEGGKIFWSEELTIPYTPMLGCIGTAPFWGVPSTYPAGPHGGNMDIIETRPGNTVYLPVFVPGGYLYLGDAHAAMGHGELSASGLEMPAETTVTVNLIKGGAPNWPRIESPEEIMCIVSGCPMERSIAQASAELILWLEKDFGWNRWRAYDILTHVAKVSVGYYAFGTAAVKIAKEYVRKPGS